jgi:hypothetical protein
MAGGMRKPLSKIKQDEHGGGDEKDPWLPPNAIGQPEDHEQVEKTIVPGARPDRVQALQVQLLVVLNYIEK